MKQERKKARNTPSCLGHSLFSLGHSLVRGSYEKPLLFPDDDEEEEEGRPLGPAFSSAATRASLLARI